MTYSVIISKRDGTEFNYNCNSLDLDLRRGYITMEVHPTSEEGKMETTEWLKAFYENDEETNQPIKLDINVKGGNLDITVRQSRLISMKIGCGYLELGFSLDYFLYS